MQSKSVFFASSNYYLIDNFDSTFRKLVLSAHAKRFNSVADARFYLAICGIDLESTVKILLVMEKSGLLKTSVANAIFAPVGCGDIANALCKMMTDSPMIPSGNQSLAHLKEELENDLPKIIRIDVPGHSYVMLACEKAPLGVLGYIYQSNVAYGMEDNSFSLAAWLMDKKSLKTNLSEHLRKLERLLDLAVPNSEKEAIYLELYCASPIVDVKVPMDMKEIISYVNSNIFLKYTVNTVRAQDMLLVVEQIKKMRTQNSEEQQQSLESYISKMKEELYPN